MKPPKIKIPETEKLFPGKFGYYYRDAALTQYAGKVKNNQWIKATPADIAKEKKTREKGKSSTPKKKTATQPAVKNNAEARKKSHLELVSFNITNKVNNIFSTGINPDGSLVMEDTIPKEYMHRIQDAFGRKNNDSPIALHTREDDARMEVKYVGYYELATDTIVMSQERARPNINLANLSPDDDEYDYFHLATHETIHSASPRFLLSEYSKQKHLRYFANPTFVAMEEGLTEYIATNVSRGLVSKSKKEPLYKFDINDVLAYNHEVEIIDTLVKYGGLDPVELFQTAKTHKELVRLIDTHQRKFLKLALIQVGFDSKTVAEYLLIAKNLAKSTQELIICDMPEPDDDGKRESGSKLLELLYSAKESYKETNRADSIAHYEIDALFNDNNFIDN